MEGSCVHTNWCNENNDIYENPVSDHCERIAGVSHALGVDLGRVHERNRKKRESL
jgi:hypothetical protein